MCHTFVLLCDGRENSPVMVLGILGTLAMVGTLGALSTLDMLGTLGT